MTGTYYLLYPLPSLALGRAAVVSTAERRPDTELAKLIHLTGRLLDVAHLILLTHAIYGYAVTNFGQFEALARPPEYVLVVEIVLDTSDIWMCTDCIAPSEISTVRVRVPLPSFW